MSRFLNWKYLVPAMLVLLLAVGYLNRKTILIEAVGIITAMNRDVAANQEVVWSKPSPEEAAQPRGDKPNVVFILADDLGFNDVSFFGGGLVPTPNIDALGQQGASMSNAYAGNAICAPSRAMILTGRYSTRFGFEFTPVPDGMRRIISILTDGDDSLHPVIVNRDLDDNMTPFHEQGMDVDEKTMGDVMQEAGYQTLHIGKWHLGSTPPFRPGVRGFDESLMMEGGLYLPKDSPDVVNSMQDFDIIDKALWKILDYAVSFNDSEMFRPDRYLTDYFTEEAVKAIHANKDRPFFLYLAHWGVHTPLQATKEDFEALSHIENRRERVYAAMIRALDRSVGRVTETLEELGLDDNTIIVFTSDNGAPDYIGLPDVNEPYRGWKITLFEGGTHVPFFVKWPGQIEPGTVLDAPASHLDILPTAAAAVNAQDWEKNPIDGANLLPYLTGEEAAGPERPIFWRQGYYQAVLSEGWKMQVSDKPEKVWLYHLDEDPTEQVNLAEKRPEKVAELQALLDDFNAEQAEPAWPSAAQLPVLIDKTGAEEAQPGDEYIYWPN